MFGVEHCYSDGRSTYEIFETLEDAVNFCEQNNRWNETNQPLFVFQADFNVKFIFKENKNQWNYDDDNKTIIGNYLLIKTYNKAENLKGFLA